jgi:hypothetical protein
MMVSSSSTWPPRRLPSRLRLFRIRFSRLRSEILLTVAARLTLWTAWVASTATVFLMIDLYT